MITLTALLNTQYQEGMQDCGLRKYPGFQGSVRDGLGLGNEAGV